MNTEGSVSCDPQASLLQNTQCTCCKTVYWSHCIRSLVSFYTLITPCFTSHIKLLMGDTLKLFPGYQQMHWTYSLKTQITFFCSYFSLIKWKSSVVSKTGFLILYLESIEVILQDFYLQCNNFRQHDLLSQGMKDHTVNKVVNVIHIGKFCMRCIYTYYIAVVNSSGSLKTLCKTIS